MRISSCASHFFDVFFVFGDAQLWEISSGGVKDISPVSSCSLCIPKSVAAHYFFKMDFLHIMQCAGEGVVRAPTDFCVEILTMAAPKQGEDAVGHFLHLPPTRQWHLDAL